MKNIHIDNSYNVWFTDEMDEILISRCMEEYHIGNAGYILNRSYFSMHIEWWLHNIVYYITKPFISINWFYNINLRCKDVDLEEWK
jgi:hypothetical protein